MLIKSFCICICRIRIRLFAHLWTVACAHPWISPISSTPRPNLRQRMGIIVKWKSFLRKELLVHNFFSVHMHISPLVSRIFCTYFCKHFCLTSHDKSYFCVFFIFLICCDMYSFLSSTLPSSRDLYSLLWLTQSLVTLKVAYAYYLKKRCLIFW